MHEMDFNTKCANPHRIVFPAIFAFLHRCIHKFFKMFQCGDEILWCKKQIDKRALELQSKPVINETARAVAGNQRWLIIQKARPILLINPIMQKIQYCFFSPISIAFHPNLLSNAYANLTLIMDVLVTSLPFIETGALTYELPYFPYSV